MAQKKTGKTISRSDVNYKIDYDMFTTEEIIKIINFFNMIWKHQNRAFPSSDVAKAYHEYRTIINNKALEKQYDAMFQKETGISIFHTLNDLGIK